MKHHTFGAYGYIFILVVVSILPFCHTAKSTDDSPADIPETNDESLDIPEDTTNYTSCPSRRNSDSSNVAELTNVNPGEFPFVAAILNHEKEFICSGTVVANGLILTAAHCLMPAPGYVMLRSTRVPINKGETAYLINVISTEFFPTYVKSNTGTTTNDVGLVMTEKFNQSVASMIPTKKYEDTKVIVDFMALGYGLNTELGSAKPLQQVIVNHRPMYDLDETFTGYLDCINTNITTCFKDTGGPAILAEELIGVVVSGQENCTNQITSEYAINKLMLKVLPTFVFQSWLNEKVESVKIKAVEESIPIHPMKPVSRPISGEQLLRRSDSTSVHNVKIAFLTTTIPCAILYLFT